MKDTDEKSKKQLLIEIEKLKVKISKLEKSETERKRAEEEMQKLVLVVKHSSELVNLGTLDGRMTFLNESGSKMLGIEPHEVENMNIMEVIPDHLTGLVEKELLPALIKGETWEGDLQYRNMRTGELTDVHAMTFTIKDPDTGKPQFLANVSLDITERKRAEKIQKVLYNISNAVTTTDNLEKLISLIKEELGTIIDTTNFYIALYNHVTNTFSLPFFVDEKDKITSFPAGKTLTYYVIKTQKSLLATKEQLEVLEQKGEIGSFGTNSEIWLGVPLKTLGKITGVLAVQSYKDKFAYNESDLEMLEFVSDQISISIERKQVEQNLKSALEKATESDRLKSVFLETMSHELRTPLNAIIGFSGIINKDFTIEEIVGFNKIINTSGNHLLSIVEDIFDITMLESGNIKLEKDDYILKDILKEVHEIIKNEQHRTNKDNLELSIIIPLAEKDLTIRTDSAKLKQVLINLLKNALKFTNAGKVSCGYKIEVKKGKSVIKFYVKDTGIGIPENMQESIFDVFRQADDSTTRLYGGTGIGLTVSKKLIELLGGKIWIESEVGKGSTFYFTIPYEKPVIIEKLTSSEQGRENLLVGKTVLVAEDVKSSFDLINVILENKGTKTIWAKDGKEAVKLCRENSNIDLILMDINMPVMNGFEATREIKKFKPDLPIIAQTAYAVTGDREKSIEAGCDDYISKPINPGKLLEKIVELLSKLSG